jgi:hypothetical protein
MIGVLVRLKTMKKDGIVSRARQLTRVRTTAGTIAGRQ